MVNILKYRSPMIRYVYIEDFISDCNSFLAEFSSVRTRTQASKRFCSLLPGVCYFACISSLDPNVCFAFFPRLVRWFGLWSSDILFVPLSSTNANIVAEQANVLSPEAGETPGQ